MKTMIKICSVFVVICIIISYVSAVEIPNSTTELRGSGSVTEIGETAKNIWSTAVVIIQIVAVATVVFAGIKYMYASADERADLKSGLTLLVIGAALVFSATTVISFITKAAEDII